MISNKLHPQFGIQITDITADDLKLTENLAKVKRSVHQNGFALINNLELRPDCAMEIANLLGDPEPGYRPEFTHRDYPELVLLGNVGEVEGGTSYLNTQGVEWHTDATGKGLTPGVTMLYCLKTPINAGDTLFASTDAAYVAMDKAQLAIYKDLQVIHSFNIHNDKVAAFSGTNVEVQQEALRKRYPDSLDTVIKIHPQTNRPCFYVSHQLVKEVVGYDYDEGMELVMKLVGHITQPKFVFRQQWKEGDLVIFDNRSCLHSATEYDYAGQERLFYQIIIAGQND